MTGFDPQNSSDISDRITNWPTTTALRIVLKIMTRYHFATLYEI